MKACPHCGLPLIPLNGATASPEMIAKVLPHIAPGLSQADIGALAGVSQKAVSRVVRALARRNAAKDPLLS